ncbi:hypothetical protein [Niallia taxi]|uniref:Uncharacterized protein n=1 Tax=Niallia taxi TaxID=2499688 RepID=A0A437K6H0_9BACI|nr:hypothetical protein [Niallia taxi]MED4040199.1 hypothetical protein [Niallia taxi]RVT58812.1 hypothetical protein EM808_20845 [Niallia taxi]
MDMNLINPILVEFLYRSTIESLPSTMREIYRFIECEEDELERMAVNESHFIKLMNEKSPIRKAAEHFSLKVPHIKAVINQAQGEIDRTMIERYKRIKWIDMTDYKPAAKNKIKSKWSFVFVN